MLSPSAAVGEMPHPWTPPPTQQVFQMPQVTFQNPPSSTNGDWGNQNIFRQSQHRPQPNMQGQWAAHKRRQQMKRESNHTAAASQWQNTNSAPISGAPQEQRGQGQAKGPAAVNLQDLPTALCRQNFLEAMMDQAGLTGNVLGCIFGQDQDVGKALIYLTDRNAAQKCAAHFHGCSWGNSGPPVMAQVVDAPTGHNGPVNNSIVNKYGNNGLDKAPGGKTQKNKPGRSSGKMRNAPWQNDAPPVLPYAAVSQPGWEGFADGGYLKQDSDDREQVSTDAGDSSRASWDTTNSSFCNCDTDDGF